jgi:hypothetical protein
MPGGNMYYPDHSFFYNYGSVQRQFKRAIAREVLQRFWANLLHWAAAHPQHTGVQRVIKHLTKKMDHWDKLGAVAYDKFVNEVTKQLVHHIGWEYAYAQSVVVQMLTIAGYVM